MSEDIQSTFENTNIESVNIPVSCYSKKNENIKKSYQHLSDVLSLGNIEFFTVTVLVGKLVVKKRKEFDCSSEQFFKMTKKNISKDEMTILKAIAVDEVDNPLILKDEKAMRSIWQEYSYSGFLKLYAWYEDGKENLEEKLRLCMEKFFESNLIE